MENIFRRYIYICIIYPLSLKKEESIMDFAGLYILSSNSYRKIEIEANKEVQNIHN